VGLTDRLDVPVQSNSNAPTSNGVHLTAGPGPAPVPHFGSGKVAGTTAADANSRGRAAEAAHLSSSNGIAAGTVAGASSVMGIVGSELQQLPMSNGFPGGGGHLGGVKKGLGGPGGPGGPLGGLGGPGRGLGSGPGGLPDVADAAVLMHMSDLRPPTPDTLALFRAPTPEVRA
jgi:hypothetical protein